MTRSSPYIPVFLLLPFVLALTMLTRVVAAEDGWRVVGHQVRPDLPVPELCLTLNQPLTEAQRGQIFGGVRLLRAAKPVELTPGQVVATGDQICLQGLKPGSGYQLAISKLLDPFDLFFDFPDRSPELGLQVINLPDTVLPVLPAEQLVTSVALTSINVEKVQVQLFRLKDPRDWSAAFRQHRQGSRTPTEGLTLAREKGELVWEQALSFSESQNIRQSRKLVLPESLPEGLYFLAVMPESAIAGRNFANPRILRGRWLGVGRLQLQAVNSDQDLTVTVTQRDGSAAGQRVNLQLLDDNGEVLASFATNQNDEARFTWQNDQRNRASLVMVNDTAAGPAFIALRDLIGLQSPLPPRHIFAAKDSFQAGEQAVFTLLATDYHDRPVATEAGWLRLYRPDWSLAGQEPIPAGRVGPFFVRMTLPARGEAGSWHIEWQTVNGQKLAQLATQVRASAAPVEVAILQKPAAVPMNSTISLDVMARNAAGQAEALQQGIVRWRPVSLTDPAWPDYHFGLASVPSASWSELTRFVTGSDGNAHLELAIPLKKLPEPVSAIELNMALIQGSEVQSFVLPIADSNPRIGVRPKPSPELDQAVFDVIALDAGGQRQSMEGLTYHLYERGRKFNWYQEAGHWAYRPLPNLRRIGGGPLAIDARTPTTLRWPLGTGNYTLEITDRSGKALARYDFTGSTPKPQSLPKLITQPETWQVGKAQKIKVEVTKTGWVTLVVQDALTRAVMTRLLQPGTHELVVIPAAGWGRRVTVTVLASPETGEQQIIGTWSARILPEQSQSVATLQIPEQLISGRNIELAATLPEQVEWLSLLLTAQTAEATPPVLIDAVKPDGHSFVFRPYLPEHAGNMSVQLMSWGAEGWSRQISNVTVKPALQITGDLPQRLQLGDTIATRLTLAGNELPAGKYQYTITASQGLTLLSPPAGKIDLGTNRTASLPLKLRARAAGEANLELQIIGPNDQRFQRRWMLTVQAGAPRANNGFVLPPGQSRTEKADKGNVDARHYLMGPVPLAGTVSALQTLLDATPVTAADLSAWLTTVAQWRELIIALELASPARLDALQAKFANNLLLLQANDGAFRLDPISRGGDLASTAVAIPAIPGESYMWATALDWLQRQLNNSWQIDQNIDARAQGFAVLAMYGRADIAALRYFAATLKDKPVSALTAAALALAFDKAQDQDAAQHWLQQALAAVQASSVAAEHWQVWGYLSQCSQAPLADLAVSLTASPPQNLALKDQAVRLQTLLRLGQRQPEWQLTIDGEVKTFTGLQRITLATGRKELVLVNSGTQKLEANTLDDQLTKVSGSRLTYRAAVYHLDGTPLVDGAGLERGNDYVLILELPVVAARHIVMPQTGGINFVSLQRVDEPMLRPILPWITSLSAGETAATDESVLWQLTGTSRKALRLAVLLKPDVAGAYALPRLTMLDADGRATRIQPAANHRLTIY